MDTHKDGKVRRHALEYFSKHVAGIREIVKLKYTVVFFSCVIGAREDRDAVSFFIK
jgi:hypothetical protein